MWWENEPYTWYEWVFVLTIVTIGMFRTLS